MKNLSYFQSITTIADRIILSIAVILLVWLYMRYWVSERQSADYALIWVANQPARQINLQHAQQVVVQGSIGESIIEVLEGRIRFIKSPCRNQYCIHAGWLMTNRDFVACLPNQVSIELYRASTTEFDAIAY